MWLGCIKWGRELPWVCSQSGELQPSPARAVAVPGQAAVVSRSQLCSGSCRWPQHGVRDKPQLRAHLPALWLQRHKGQCSP